MAVWYCGTVQHAAIAQFAISHAYNVGDIVRQLAAPSDLNARAFRCTTAGTSAGAEPAWNLGPGQTTTSGGATFTEVTGNSTYGWAAAHKTMSTAMATNRMSAGDTLYVASNHALSTTGGYTIGTNGSRTNPLKVVSVNASGSVPPVSADLQSGASEGTDSGYTINNGLYCYGVTFKAGVASAATQNLTLNSANSNGGVATQIYENCRFELSSTGSGSRIVATDAGDADRPQAVIWNNCILKFGSTGQTINFIDSRIIWNRGSVDSGGSAPTTLFSPNGVNGNFVQVIGVDLSALATNTIVAAGSGNDVYQFINCRLGTGYVLTGTIGGLHSTYVDMIISDNTSKNYNNERHTGEGDLLTETTNVRSSGANDGVTAYSWKVTTNANATYGFPFECFTEVIWNDTTGSSKTLTIEILNSATTLKDNDIWVDVEYLNSASYPTTDLATSASNILAAGSNLTTSSETWDTTGISSPTKQKMSVSFTPQMKGYIRYTVKVAKASKTIWIDPKATIT